MATAFGLHGSALTLHTCKQGEQAIARAAFQQPNVKSMHVQAMQLQRSRAALATYVAIYQHQAVKPDYIPHLLIGSFSAAEGQDRAEGMAYCGHSHSA